MAAFFVNSVLTTDKRKFLVWHLKQAKLFTKRFWGKMKRIRILIVNKL
ncbi:hypothetical protein METH109765_18415 [Mesobacillus thioparans]